MFSSNPPDDSFQCAYKSIWLILKAISSFFHNIRNSLGASTKTVCYAFLDYSSVFDSISWYLLLGFTRPLLVWSSGYLTNKIQSI